MLEFLTVLSRRWRIVMSLVLLGIAAAAVITQQLTPRYEADAQVFVALDTGSTAAELNSAATFSTQRVTSYADLVQSPLVLDPVIDDLGLDVTATELATQVEAQVAPDTVLIEIFVSDESPQAAADIANAVATNLASAVETLDRTPSSTTSPVRLSTTRPAVPPSGPVSPVPALNLAIGLVAGLLLGLTLAAVREALDTTLKDDGDVVESSGLPTLALVPTNEAVEESPLISRSPGNPVWAESYRKLRTNLSYVDPDDPARVIVVASALAGDGKSLTAANLACSLAQSGKRTVLVEADLRRPSLAGLLALASDIGVTTVVTGKADLADAVQRTDLFDVVTSGPIPPNPSELLGSQSFSAMIERLRGEYDYVVVDTPPLVAVTDAAVVSVVADAVVVVVKAKRTRRQDLRRALYGLRAVDANVVGVVLNQMNAGTMNYYRYEYTPRRPPLPSH